MSYSTEHRRLRPVLDKARRLDIASHPGPNSLFEALGAGFNIWCTPDDHPKGWEDVKMDAGAFAKPCEYVGTATWGWTKERITHIELGTEAYALRDRHRGPPRRDLKTYRDRLDDIAWAAAKVAWIFSIAGMECPPIRVGQDDQRVGLDFEIKNNTENWTFYCPSCGSRLQMTQVYFQKSPRILLFCTNSGSCNFREI